MNLNDFEIENGKLIEYCGISELVIIPNSVTSIRKWAFNWCESLQSIIIPNSVTSIGDGAFKGCKSLKKIYAPKGLDLSETDYPSDCEIIQQ